MVAMAKDMRLDNADSSKERAEEDLFLRYSEGDEGRFKREEDDPDLHLEDSREELSLQHVQQGSGHDSDNTQTDNDAAVNNRTQHDASERSDALADSEQIAIDVASEISNGNDRAGDQSTLSSISSSTQSEQRHDHSDQEHQPAGTTNAELRSDVEHAEVHVATPAMAAQRPIINDELGAEAVVPDQEQQAFFNTGPDAGDDVHVIANEGQSTLDGQLTAVDEDPNSSLHYSVADGYPSPVGFSLDQSGVWSFDATEPAYDHLSPGDSLVFTIPVAVTDSYGETGTLQIQITLKGSNDMPVADADVARVVDESAGVIEGQLVASDVDSQQLSYDVATGVDVPDGFSLSADGRYSFNPADQAYDYLGVGDSEIITIPVQVSDESGAIDSSQIQISINGTNDGPVAGAGVIAAVDEGAAIVSGQLTASDVDQGATVSFVVENGFNAPPGFSLDSDGSYQFDPAGSAYEHLGVGDVEVLDIPVTITDERGATTSTQLQISVNGTNDGPIAGASVTAAVNEGAALVNGQLTANDADQGTTLSFAVEDGFDAPTGFSLAADGSYQFDPADTAYDRLGADDVQLFDIPVTITDEHGATSSTQLQITVNGTNDGPVANASVVAAVNEGAAVVGGQLTASDADQGSALSFAVEDGFSAPPGFSLAADGSYHFDPADSAYEHLGVGDVEILGIPVTVTDEQGASTSTQLQITVNGSNDGPVAGASVTAAVSEGAAVVSGQLTASDVDQGSTVSFEVEGGFDIPPGFKLDADGSYQFDPADPAYDHLAAGDVHLIDIPVTVTDEHGAADTTQIQITVNGTNDAPVAGASIAPPVYEDSSVLQGQVDASDADHGSALSFAVADGIDVPAGFALDADGSYRFDSGDSAYNDLRPGETQELTIPVTVTDELGASTATEVRISVLGTNESPVAVDDSGYQLQNATLAAELNFDNGVPQAARGSVTTAAEGQLDAGADLSSAKIELSGIELNADAGAQTTVSMWVKADPSGSWEMLAASDRYDMVMLNDSIGFNTSRGDLYGADASELSDGEWHHVVGTFTNGDVTQNTLYIDGQEKDLSQLRGTPSSNYANIDSSDGNLYFGSWGVNDNYRFSGSMDEIKVFNGSLSSDEVNTLYKLEADHVKWDGAVLNGSEDQALIIDPSDLLANDFDPDGGALSIASVQDAEHGVVEIDAEGNVVFTPDADYHGEASFSYTLSDGDSGQSTATATLHISSENDLPTIDVVNTITVDEDGSQNINYRIADLDGDDVTLTGHADNGSVVVNGDGTMTFTPDENYQGADTITLTATDSQGGVTTHEIGVTVNGVNDAPQAVADTNFEPQSATLTAELNFDNGVPNALQGHVGTEAEGQVAAGADFTSAKVELGGIDLNAEAGAQTTVSMWVQADPSGGWEMLAASDRYDMVMLNGDIGFNTARGDLFGANADALADGEWHHIVGTFTNGDVTQNTLYIDGVEQNLTQIRGTPSSANANIDSSDGNLYFGSWGANNNYRFSGSMDEIKVFDGTLSTEEANTLYSIESDHMNSGGAAMSTDEDSSIVIDVLANDIDVDGDALTITDAGIATDANGNIAGSTEIVEVDGRQQIRFTPDDSLDALDEGDSETVSFSYTISDEHGQSSSAEVSVNVTGVDDGPTIKEIFGTRRSERLTGTEESERISGLDGNDTIRAGDGDDTLVGGAGSDNLYGGSGDDTFVVDAANAGAANDYHGGDGTDRIVAQDGEDITINRHLRGSDSIEEIVGEGDTALSGDNSSQTLDLRNTQLTGIDHVDGGGGNDTIYNSHDGGEVYGGAGSDNLFGGSGDDTFVVDAANAGAANDYHGGDGTDRIVAQDGEDVTINRHLRGSDSIEEIVGEGDTVLAGDNSSQTLDLRNTQLTGIDHVDGGGGNDTIYNSHDGGEVYGGAGSDNLFGGSGDDTFVVDAANAGAANDYHGGDGTDRIVARDGEDVTINRHLRGSDSIEEIVGEGDTVLAGDNSSQTLDLRDTQLTGIDHVDGGGGNDTIYNSDDGGEVHGGEGHDRIHGGDGNDMLAGDAGKDRLYGGEGDDTIAGGSGNDRAWGGDGNDTYVVNPFDGSDYFHGGNGGGWTDAVDVSANIAADPDSPWTVEVGGAQVQYELASGALELNPDTSGVITFGDGSELAFDGLEKIEW
jgi:VCBS repeat-containing protein